MSPMHRGRPSLGEFVVIGLLVAVAYSILALVGIGIAFVLELAGADMGFPSIRALAIAFLYIVLSYLGAGIIGALALWVLHPIEQSFVGCVLRGAVLAPIIYCSIGFASVFLYVNAGVNIFEFESTQEAWHFLRWSLPAFSGLGAVIWGPMMWYDAQPKRS